MANLAVCNFVGEQTQMASVSDGSGGAIVVWQDWRTTDGDLYAQHVLGSGELDPHWPAYGVVVSQAVGLQNYPSVCSDGAGGALVVWHDFRSSTSGTDIYAQRISAAGAPVWTTDGVAVCTADKNQVYASVVSDASGGAIVAWQDGRDYLNQNIYAQRISANGTPLWAPNGALVCAAASDQEYAVEVSDGVGGVIVVWHDYRAGSDLYAQRLDSTGVSLWALDGLSLCSAPADQTGHVIASDEAGGVIAAWVDHRSPGTTKLYAQRVSSSGSALWDTDGIPLSAVASQQLLPSIVSDGVGGAIMAWSDYRTGVSDIYAQRVDASGLALWDGGGVAVCRAYGDQQNPAIASDGSGGAVLSWQDYRSSSVDIFAQRVNGAGACEWEADGVALSLATSSQILPRVTPDGSGGAMVCWQDYRGGSASDIYAQGVTFLGSRGASVAPTIAGVRDTPNDQGGKVKVMWNASLLDADPFRAVTDYRIWRSVPPQVALTRLAAGSRLQPAGGRDASGPGSLRATAAVAGTIYWEYVATQFARRFEGYSAVVSTTSDSVPGSNPQTLFMIEARGTDGVSYWDSAPDSGYSVDNLSPPIPSPFVANYDGTDVALHWGPSSAPDFAEFVLYRGGSADFVPGPATFLYAGADTALVDPEGIGGFYKLAARDIHGNRGRFALVSPNSPVSTLASLATSEWTGAALELAWYGAGIGGLRANVYRAETSEGWHLVGEAVADGVGYVRYSDSSVLPGHRYSYRLGIVDGDVERVAGEATVDIPGGRLSIRAVAANPVRGGMLTCLVGFANASPVVARIFDLSGRMLSAESVRPGATGQLNLSLTAAPRLAPGIYVLELSQGRERAKTRFTYLR